MVNIKLATLNCIRTCAQLFHCEISSLDGNDILFSLVKSRRTKNIVVNILLTMEKEQLDINKSIENGWSIFDAAV